MTRRYDVRTGMVDEDPDAGQPREELVPGWHVPGPTRYDYDLRIGDAERDLAMTQLREHFVAGRLTLADISVSYPLHLVGLLGLDNLLGPRSAAYHERLRARPAYQRAIAVA